MPKETELERLKRELKEANEKLSKRNAISFKVSEKGALSLYGMGRFPVTLYKEQWERLLAEKDAILEFIEQHQTEFKTKE